MDVLTKNVLDKMDLSNTIMHGLVDSSLLPIFYRDCDLGLSPSMFDPCPNSVVEMMACGLPVITVGESGASELVEVDELIIYENLGLKYYELQTIDMIPKINIDKWVRVIKNVLRNNECYRNKMLSIVSRKLDIKVVAKKYAEFISSV